MRKGQRNPFNLTQPTNPKKFFNRVVEWVGKVGWVYMVYSVDAWEGGEEERFEDFSHFKPFGDDNSRVGFKLKLNFLGMNSVVFIFTIHYDTQAEFIFTTPKLRLQKSNIVLTVKFQSN